MGMGGDLMAKLKFEGMQEYEKMLSKLQTGTEQIIGKAVYAGAKIVADEIKANINSLGVEQGQEGGSGKLLSGSPSTSKVRTRSRPCRSIKYSSSRMHQRLSR